MSRRKPLQVTRTTGKALRSRSSNKLETLWDDLLSRQPERVRAAYTSMKTSEQKAVVAHLQRMVDEPGWQPEQRSSALAALKALENQAK
jgi:hypothetical protein